MFSLAPSRTKVSKSADTVFFSTKLLSSPPVSLCFDNRSVMKNKPRCSTKATSGNRAGWGVKNPSERAKTHPFLPLGNNGELRALWSCHKIFTHQCQ